LAVTGVAQEGATLTATLSNVSDLDGATTTSYQWQQQVSGVWTNLSGATSASYTLASDQSQIGIVLRVVATTTDALGGTTEFIGNAATVSNVNDAPTGTVSITGTPLQGQTLTVVNGLNDGDGIPTDGPVSPGYQWQRDGAPIPDATSSTYSLTKADVGHAIAVQVSYVDLQGTAEQVTSMASLIAAATTTVSVLTYLWKSHGLIPSVQVNANGQTNSTNITGTTSIELPIDQTLAVQTTKTLNPSEQASADSAVNLQDAIAILKMIVGLDVNGAGKPLSPYQSLAADFDGNGTVSLTDAIGVLKHVVGLASPDPTLKFVDETSSVVSNISTHPLKPGTPPAIQVDTTDHTVLHVGAVGYLSGDVDGSYAGGATSTLPPEYFTALHASTGISLSQFGVYGG
jgi:hypothetical protein